MKDTIDYRKGYDNQIQIQRNLNTYEQSILETKMGRFDPGSYDLFEDLIYRKISLGGAFKNIRMPFSKALIEEQMDDDLRNAIDVLHGSLFAARSKWLTDDKAKTIDTINIISMTLGILVCLATLGALAAAFILLLPTAWIILLAIPAYMVAAPTSLFVGTAMESLTFNLLFRVFVKDKGFEDYCQHFRLICEAEADLRRAKLFTRNLKEDTLGKINDNGFDLAKYLALEVSFDKEGTLTAKESSLVEKLPKDMLETFVSGDSNWEELLKNDDFGLSEYEKDRLVTKLKAFSAYTKSSDGDPDALTEFVGSVTSSFPHFADQDTTSNRASPGSAEVDVGPSSPAFRAEGGGSAKPVDNPDSPTHGT